MRILLRRTHFTSGFLNTLFEFRTLGAVPAFRTEVIRAADISYRVIRNSKYQYYAVVGFQGAGWLYRFRALRIDYTVP